MTDLIQFIKESPKTFATIVSLIVGPITYLGTVYMQNLKFNQEKEKQKLDFDNLLQAEKEKHRLELDKQKNAFENNLVVQEERIKLELRTEFMAEQAVKTLLMHKDWKQRSIDAIEKKIGGFEKNELRKLLVRTGAVRFFRKGDKEVELWGLISRNEESLNN